MDGCALADRAVDRHEAARLSDRAMDRSEAQPRALAGILGREEQLHCMLEYSGLMPCPVSLTVSIT
jgi:hypothetical protein